MAPRPAGAHLVRHGVTGSAPRLTTIQVETADAGTRLDTFLARRVPGISRSQAHRLIDDGHVTVAGATAIKSSAPVVTGQLIQIMLPAPVPATPAAEDLPLEILHDDADLVVVNKPAGMVVHPAAGHSSGTLVNALLHHVRGLSGIGGAERPGIVHRLDRGTSGVLVVAKSDRAHRELARQFHDREVSKQYEALVWGTPRAGLTLDRPIGRHPSTRTKMSTRARRTRTALTRIDEVEPLGGVSRIVVTIATGRTHQIRVHLSEANHPVVGDELYGGVRQRLPPRLRVLGTLSRPFLHASRLTVTHPSTGKRLTFEAEWPADLRSVVASLRAALPPQRRKDSA